MRKEIKKWIPRRLLYAIRRRRERIRESEFVNQKLKSIRCGDFEIRIPESHILLSLQDKQPLRDICVGISAMCLGIKYPNSTMIDVGANIGDTAAIIASYASNKLILVEGSDYYHSLLEMNSRQFRNEISIKKMFLVDGKKIDGHLTHWGGTAFFDKNNCQSNSQYETERLCNLTDQEVSFVKLDTDGSDFSILLDSMDWLGLNTPAILFENQIPSQCELERSCEVLKQLVECGYNYFILWDDAGFHLLSTTCVLTVNDMSRYLFNVHKNAKYISIYNTDVLCLHVKDKDVYEHISAYYRHL
jgi:FkbM family methyltransferase